MTVNLSNSGVREIVNNFDLFYIDIWGVLHNGIRLNDEAVNVLQELDNLRKELENCTEEIRLKSLKKDYKETGIKANNDILDDDLTIIGIGHWKS